MADEEQKKHENREKETNRDFEKSGILSNYTEFGSEKPRIYRLIVEI